MSVEDDVIKIPKRLLFIAIILCLCINIFSVLMGILIGKGDLNWSEGEGQPLPQQELPEVSGQQSPIDSDLALFDEDSRDEQPADLTAYDAVSEKTSAAEPPPARPVERPVETKPEPRPRETAPDPTPSPPPVTAFWVQVAAFRDQPAAEKLQRRVVEKGYGARVLPEGAYFKVLVGPYRTRAEADRVKPKVNQTFKAKGWVRELR